MKFTSTREFREKLAAYLEAAEGDETVYILRPGGKVLKVSRVPEGDLEQVISLAKGKSKVVH